MEARRTTTRKSAQCAEAAAGTTQSHCRVWKGRRGLACLAEICCSSIPPRVGCSRSGREFPSRYGVRSTRYLPPHVCITTPEVPSPILRTVQYDILLFAPKGSPKVLRTVLGRRGSEIGGQGRKAGCRRTPSYHPCYPRTGYWCIFVFLDGVRSMYHVARHPSTQPRHMPHISIGLYRVRYFAMIIYY